MHVIFQIWILFAVGARGTARGCRHLGHKGAHLGDLRAGLSAPPDAAPAQQVPGPVPDLLLRQSERAHEALLPRFSGRNNSHSKEAVSVTGNCSKIM
jgi:hypothetical protein